MSIAIDPLDAGRAARDSAAGPPLPTDLPAPTPTPPTEPVQGKESQPLAPPSLPAKLQLGAGLAGAIGQAPSLSAGFLLEARLRWPRVSLGLEGQVDIPVLAPLLHGQVTSSLLGGTVSPCLHFGLLAACGLLEAGALHTSASGFEQSNSVWSPHLAAGGRAAVEFELSPRWTVRAQAELLVRVVRIILTVDEQQAWLSAPLFGGLGLVAVAAF